MPTLDVQVLEMEWVVSSCLVLPSLDLVWLEDAKTDSDCTTKSTNVHDAPSHSAALGLCAFIDEHRTIVRTKCNRRVDRHSAGSIYRVHDLCQSAAQHIRRNGHHPHHQWMEILGIQKGFESGKLLCPFDLGLSSYLRPLEKLLQRSRNCEWDTSTGMKFNKRLPKNPDTWNMSSHSLRVHRKPDAGAPETWEYAVHYPKAEQRERILADTNTKDPKAYVIRQQQIDDDTRHGLYLPSPSSITYTIDVPDNAKFHGELVHSPGAADPALHSDGASNIG